MKIKKHYVDPNEFRASWSNWMKTGDENSWKYLCESVYKICSGVSTRFHPRDENEHSEYTHHAFAETILKMKNGRDGKTPKILDNGKTSPFNLLTTAINNTLYTYMSKKERQRFHYNKYKEQQIHLKKHIVTQDN